MLNCVFKDSNGRYIVLNINSISCSFQACFFILLELLNQVAQWLLNIFTRISCKMKNKRQSLSVAHFIDSGYCLVILSCGCPHLSSSYSGWSSVISIDQLIGVGTRECINVKYRSNFPASIIGRFSVSTSSETSTYFKKMSIICRSYVQKRCL